MSAPVDREQLRRDLSDALSAIQRDCDVTGLDVLAASLTTLEGSYAFHGRLLRRARHVNEPLRGLDGAHWCAVRRGLHEQGAGRRRKGIRVPHPKMGTEAA